MAIIPAAEKVFMVSNSTNTTYSGSASLKAMQQWYTMQDVIDTVGGGGSSPYKVFTALLTQSGTGNPDAINNDSLVIGTTYEILNTDGGTVNFTNVGAPNNLIGTSFIATGTTPTSWGQTNDGLLGFNSGAVISVILENTIGNLYWSYNGNGSAALMSNALFTDGKTSVTVATPMGEGEIRGSAGGEVIANSVIVLQYRELNNIPTNDLLYNTLIEVRVYN